VERLVSGATRELCPDGVIVESEPSVVADVDIDVAESVDVVVEASDPELSNDSSRAWRASPAMCTAASARGKVKISATSAVFSSLKATFSTISKIAEMIIFEEGSAAADEAVSELVGVDIIFIKEIFP
jgi:hypothetical protein